MFATRRLTTGQKRDTRNLRLWPYANLSVRFAPTKEKGRNARPPFRTAVMLVTGQTYSHRKLGIAPSGRRQISRFRYGLRFEGHDVGRGPFQFPQQAPDEPFLAPVKAQPPTGINP
jgi:hypothetical protein